MNCRRCTYLGAYGINWLEIQYPITATKQFPGIHKALTRIVFRNFTLVSYSRCFYLTNDVRIILILEKLLILIVYRIHINLILLRTDTLNHEYRQYPYTNYPKKAL